MPTMRALPGGFHFGGLGFWVLGVGFRVSGLGFSVLRWHQYWGLPKLSIPILRRGGRCRVAFGKGLREVCGVEIGRLPETRNPNP